MSYSRRGMNSQNPQSDCLVWGLGLVHLWMTSNHVLLTCNFLNFARLHPWCLQPRNIFIFMKFLQGSKCGHHPKRITFHLIICSGNNVISDISVVAPLWHFFDIFICSSFNCPLLSPTTAILFQIQSLPHFASHPPPHSPDSNTTAVEKWFFSNLSWFMDIRVEWKTQKFEK